MLLLILLVRFVVSSFYLVKKEIINVFLISMELCIKTCTLIKRFPRYLISTLINDLVN